MQQVMLSKEALVRRAPSDVKLKEDVKNSQQYWFHVFHVGRRGWLGPDERIHKHHPTTADMYQDFKSWYDEVQWMEATRE